MLRYLYGHEDLVSKYVATLVPHCRRGFENCKTIGVLDEEGLLLGAIVYHNWDPEAETIEMSGAAISPRWLTRETLARIFQYPFHDCGCQMVFMRVPFDSKRVLGILATYGFRFLEVPRMFGRTRDGVICRLTREDWEANKFNKRLKHHVKDAPAAEAA